ncbi:hypothetical protein [Flavobacterium sp. GCM10027622]|uniref:hypothetical protein n=1 Tax=unclassified Flavobacterium TaxID=196869 RepID=UPI00360F88F6
MLKSILKLEGAQELNNDAQKGIMGGAGCSSNPLRVCPPGYIKGADFCCYKFDQIS